MIYEKVEVEPNVFMIKKTEADGKEWWIPLADDNSDYQAYLNRDKVEHLTEIIPADEA